MSFGQRLDSEKHEEFGRKSAFGAKV